PPESTPEYPLPVLFRRSVVRSFVLFSVVLTASLAGPALTAAHVAKPVVSRGYDISWPQCGGAYPSNPAFGIVGVNKGIVFSPNPCLASEIRWGGGAAAQLYANTGNPGPALS